MGLREKGEVQMQDFWFRSGLVVCSLLYLAALLHTYWDKRSILNRYDENEEIDAFLRQVAERGEGKGFAVGKPAKVPLRVMRALAVLCGLVGLVLFYRCLFAAPGVRLAPGLLESTLVLAAVLGWVGLQRWMLFSRIVVTPDAIFGRDMRSKYAWRCWPRPSVGTVRTVRGIWGGRHLRIAFRDGRSLKVFMLRNADALQAMLQPQVPSR